MTNKKTIQLVPPIDPITIAEYVRRKNELLLSNNPGALKVHDSAVRRKIAGGFIEVVESGGNFFIDWPRYKEFVFRTARRKEKTLEAGA
jgi:hypothetical protein